MKTVGNFLKDARQKKKYSLIAVEQKTKIKKEFISAIEREDWGKLPAFPVVVGFVKNFAGFVDLDQEKVVALLRRDYPPKKLSIVPSPDVSKGFRWSPRLTFLAGALGIVLIILGYLGFQYFIFTSPPKLVVEVPKEAEEIFEPLLKVSGQTDSGSTIRVNNQPALVDAEGNFVAEIEINKETMEIEIKAISRSGKETTVRRRIELVQE